MVPVWRGIFKSMGRIPRLKARDRAFRLYLYLCPFAPQKKDTAAIPCADLAVCRSFITEVIVQIWPSTSVPRPPPLNHPLTVSRDCCPETLPLDVARPLSPDRCFPAMALRLLSSDTRPMTSVLDRRPLDRAGWGGALRGRAPLRGVVEKQTKCGFGARGETSPLLKSLVLPEKIPII